MRHVSRTHKVALDWLFDRMLTKGNFTHDQLNNLLHLFNISHFSSLCCAQNFRLTSCTKTMAKRMQEQEEENRIVDKSKPTMNLVSLVSTSFSTVQSPIASKSPGILKALCRTDWSNTGKLDARDRDHDAVSSSQRLQKDAFLDGSTGKLVATEEDQEHLNCPEDSVSTRKFVAPGNPGILGTSGTEGNDKDWRHNLHISTNYVLHMEKVFSIVRQRCCISPTDRMTNPDVNTAFWCVFMSVTLQVAVHLGKDYTKKFK